MNFRQETIGKFLTILDHFLNYSTNSASLVELYYFAHLSYYSAINAKNKSSSPDPQEVSPMQMSTIKKP